MGSSIFRYRSEADLARALGASPSRMAITRYGYVAVGSTHCPPGGGSKCQQAPAHYLSTDGLTWQPFETPVGDIFVVDGPVGVIGVSRSAGEVWVLPE